MTGRRTRLSWVTALTVLSLLFGAGTLNALADGHGGSGHGGGSGKVEHHDVQSDDHHGQSANHGPSANQGHGNAHDDDQNDDVDDDEDVKVTDDVRPGKGCGDENHEHERHDECNGNHQDHDDDDSGS